jgi:hypothetical protein
MRCVKLPHASCERCLKTGRACVEASAASPKSRATSRVLSTVSIDSSCDQTQDSSTAATATNVPVVSSAVTAVASLPSIFSTSPHAHHLSQDDGHSYLQTVAPEENSGRQTLDVLSVLACPIDPPRLGTLTAEHTAEMIQLYVIICRRRCVGTKGSQFQRTIAIDSTSTLGRRSLRARKALICASNARCLRHLHHFTIYLRLS